MKKTPAQPARIMEITECHCNACNGVRTHTVLHKEHTSKWLDDDDQIGMFYCHEMLKCCGCSSVILRRTSHFSEDEPGIHTVDLFPPATARLPPRWLDDLNQGNKTKIIHGLLMEVYIALQNGMKRLATMGIRSVLESVMISAVGDQGTFKNNLGRFAAKNGLSPEQVDVLAIVLDAGHAATHRDYCPDDSSLHTCIDITESIVQVAYVLPQKAKQLKKQIPRRKRTSRPKNSGHP